jgi:hypothetical protein
LVYQSLQALHLLLKRYWRNCSGGARRQIRTGPTDQFERPIYYLLGLGELLLFEERLKILHDLTNGLEVLPFLLPFLDLPLKALHLSLKRRWWTLGRRSQFVYEFQSTVDQGLCLYKLLLIHECRIALHQLAYRLEVSSLLLPLLNQSTQALHLLVDAGFSILIVLRRCTPNYTWEAQDQDQ